MRKRGASHIEMIFSFILFISVITFALFFFQPAEGPDVTDSTLPFVFREVNENVSVRMDSFSVKIIDANGGLVVLDFEGTAGKIPRVEKSLQGEEVVIKSEKLTLPAEGVIFEYVGPGFFVVKFSEDFLPGEAPSGSHSSEILHELASTSSRKLVSEKRFKSLIESYNSNYDGLKISLAVPPNMDFMINLVVGEDVYSVERNIPQGLEIYSTNKRVEIMREDGSLVFGDILVTIW